MFLKIRTKIIRNFCEILSGKFSENSRNNYKQTELFVKIETEVFFVYFYSYFMIIISQFLLKFDIKTSYFASLKRDAAVLLEV